MSLAQQSSSIARIAAFAAIYVAAARLGLALDAVGGFATLVWPPTGIALAAVLLLGYRVWPGVAIGAFVANLWTGAPLLVALGIALGNTLEAIVGAYLLRRVSQFRTSLDRLVDVFALIGFAAALSTIVSATIGVASIYLGGVIPAAQIPEAWRAWWLGDFIGALLVAPVILVWASGTRVIHSWKRWAEAVALGVAIVGVALLTYTRSTPVAPDAIIPVLIWAALRFGPRGAATASFIVAAIAITGTVMGEGPFVRPQLRDSLLALQAYLGIIAATFLVLGASFAETTRAEGEARLAQANADKANQAKAEFMAVMSHELRTPLNAISGYVELLTMGMQGPVTEKQLDSLRRIQRSQQHLLSLIEDILSFAKVEAGRLRITSECVSVCKCIDEIEPLIQPELRKKQLVFVREPCDDTLSVNADPEKLRQILLNMLSNAIKYTDVAGRVSIGVERQSDNVRIWVTDSGIGIPKDQVAKVFEPFFQAERGTTRRYAGIGLGLTISRELARAMQGDVTITSEPGVGTTVSLILPLG